MTDNISNILNGRVSGANATVKQANNEAVKAPTTEEANFDPVPILGEPSRNGDSAQQQESFDAADLQDKVAEINQFIQNVRRDLSFGIDDQSGRTVITVTDSETGQLVRQIPSEETLAVVRQLSDAIEQSTADGDTKIPNGIILSFSV